MPPPVKVEVVVEVVVEVGWLPVEFVPKLKWSACASALIIEKPPL